MFRNGRYTFSARNTRFWNRERTYSRWAESVHAAGGISRSGVRRAYSRSRHADTSPTVTHRPAPADRW